MQQDIWFTMCSIHDGSERLQSIKAGHQTSRSWHCLPGGLVNDLQMDLNVWEGEQGKGRHIGEQGNQICFSTEVNSGSFGSVIPWLRADSRCDLLKLNVHFSLHLQSYLLMLACRDCFLQGFKEKTHFNVKFTASNWNLFWEELAFLIFRLTQSLLCQMVITCFCASAACAEWGKMEDNVVPLNYWKFFCEPRPGRFPAVKAKRATLNRTIFPNKKH